MSDFDTVITRLTGPDRVRKRVRVLFGFDTVEGVHNALDHLLAIFSREAAKYGGRVELTLFQDGSVSLRDYGRGIFVGSAADPDGTRWESRFTQLDAASLYQPELDMVPAMFENAEVSFMSPAGSDTMYLCSNQYVCEYMDVQVWRDGCAKQLRFEKGEAVGGLTEKPDSATPTGTELHFRYDAEVFTEVKPHADAVETLLRKWAQETPGVTYVLKQEREDGFAEACFRCAE